MAVETMPDLDFPLEPGEVETEVQNLEPTEQEPQEQSSEQEQPQVEAPEQKEEEKPLAEQTPPSTTTEEEEPKEEPKGEEDDLETLRRQLAEAQGELFNLRASQQKPLEDAPSQAPTPPKEEPKVSPQPQPQQTTVDFFQGEDFAGFFEDAKRFNVLLNRVATVAMNAAVSVAQERILRQIPSVVETTANQQFRIKEIVNDFYGKHKDLEPYKPAVSMAAMKIYNDNPNMQLPEILHKAAEETRKFLRLRPANVVRPRNPAKPVGNGGGGTRQTAPTLTDQEKQILDLLS